jgi:hypothetical protein
MRWLHKNTQRNKKKDNILRPTNANSWTTANVEAAIKHQLLLPSAGPVALAVNVHSGDWHLNPDFVGPNIDAIHTQGNPRRTAHVIRAK